MKSNPDYFLNIEIRILYNGKLELEYFDDGVGVSEDMYEKIGKLGYSKNGSGLGLQNIIKIISSWGGEFHFLKVQNGFKCSISLLAKNA